MSPEDASTSSNTTRDGTPSDLADTVAFALRFEGWKRVHEADEYMAALAARRIVRHLELFGMRKPPRSGRWRQSGRQVTRILIGLDLSRRGPTREPSPKRLPIRRKKASEGNEVMRTFPLKRGAKQGESDDRERRN